MSKNMNINVNMTTEEEIEPADSTDQSWPNEEKQDRKEENKEDKEAIEADIEDGNRRRQVLLKFVRARFPGNPKSFTYRVTNEKFHHGDKIVAMTDRGIDIGIINSFIFEQNYPEDKIPPVHRIIRRATPEDMSKKEEQEKKLPGIKEEIWHLIEKFKLNMLVSHICFTQWGKKIVIYYTAPERVDFRELVKELTRSLRSPIELRQISTIDRSMAIGGFSIYGVENYSYLPEGKIHQEKGKSRTASPSASDLESGGSDGDDGYEFGEQSEIHNGTHSDVHELSAPLEINEKGEN